MSKLQAKRNPSHDDIDSQSYQQSTFKEVEDAQETPTLENAIQVFTDGAFDIRQLQDVIKRFLRINLEVMDKPLGHMSSLTLIGLI